MILLVDDQKVHHVVLRAIVENRSQSLAWNKICELRSAYNGEECLELIRKEKVDIILLDIDMPGIKGDEVIEKIRGEWGEGLRVLMLTADDRFLEGKKYEALGFNGYIGKPYEVEDIVEYLERELD